MENKRKRLPNSVRAFIRKEKARIRKQVFNLKEEKELIDELYKKFDIKSIKAAGIVKAVKVAKEAKEAKEVKEAKDVKDAKDRKEKKDKKEKKEIKPKK